MKRACLFCETPISKADWDGGQRFCPSKSGIHRFYWRNERSSAIADVLDRFPRDADAVAAWKALERTLHRIAPEPQESS